MIIGYAYVVADLLHVGHLNFLEKCKDQCDELWVGVLTDGACKEKKPKPIIPFDERMIMVRSLKCVDHVTEQRFYSPLDNARFFDVLFESDSHDKKDIAKAKKLMKVIVIPYFPDQSSTKIKEKIRGKS